MIKYLRPLIKTALAAASLALPPMFPDALKYEPGHPLHWPFRVFAAILFLSALWEGFDESRKQIADTTPLQQPVFIGKYSQSCADALNTISDIPTYSVQQCNEAVTSLVKIIHSVVASYSEDSSNSKLNVNVMRPFRFSRSKAQSLGRGLHFFDPDKNDGVYGHILELTHWAYDDHCVPDNFSLPVHQSRRELLFGAPTTFVTGEIQVIGDIHHKRTADSLSSDQSRIIKEDIRSYLKERISFRCALCIRLSRNGRCVGILNIQTSKPKALGDNNIPSAEMKNFVLPLCLPLFEVLGMVLAELETKSAASVSQGQTLDIDKSRQENLMKNS